MTNERIPEKPGCKHYTGTEFVSVRSDIQCPWCVIERYEAAGKELPQEPKVSIDLQQTGRAWVLKADYDALRAFAVAVVARNAELERRANMRHESIAKGVFETIKDAAATWDTASDELIWQDPAVDPAVQKHWKVSKEHLETCCVRFPQWAEDLRSFAERWNEDDPLSEDDLAAVEVTDEVIERGSRQAMQILRFYIKLRKIEKERDDAQAALATARAQERERCKATLQYHKECCEQATQYAAAMVWEQAIRALSAADPVAAAQQRREAGEGIAGDGVQGERRQGQRRAIEAGRRISWPTDRRQK